MTNKIRVSTKDIVERLTGENVLKKISEETEGKSRSFTYETTWLHEDGQEIDDDPEYGADTVQVKLSINPKGDFEAFISDTHGEMQEGPFSVGNLAEVHGNIVDVRADAQMNVVDWDELFDFLDIPKGRENHLSTNLESSIKESLAKPISEIGVSSIGVKSVGTGKSSMSFEIGAHVTDPKALVRAAREVARDSGFDEDYLPGSLGDALCLLAITDNSWPSPDAIGFEFANYTDVASELALGNRPKSPSEKYSPF